MSIRRLLNPDRPLTLLQEIQHVTRKRIYAIRSIDDLVTLTELLKAEGFIGRVHLNVGPGGSVMDIALEESARVNGAPMHYEGT
jgi:hypothetical protein